MSHPLKTDICVFSNTANDWQVHSRKLLPTELQISLLRLYIDHKNENYFEVVLPTLRPNNSNMNNKSDTVMKNSIQRELFSQINKPKISAFWKANQNPSANAQHQHQQEKQYDIQRWKVKILKCIERKKIKD